VAKIVALGEKQFFVFNFELSEVENLSLDVSLGEIIATLGEALNRNQLETEEMQQLSVPLLRFLKESRAYQMALQDPTRDGFILTVFREPNTRKGRVYRANWLGSAPAAILAQNPVNLALQMMKANKGAFKPSEFHSNSRVREIMAS